MKRPTVKEALERFRKEVCANSAAVDPDDQQDWYALSVGFFLATGLTADEAHDAAREARYTHQYWTGDDDGNA